MIPLWKETINSSDWGQSFEYDVPIDAGDNVLEGLTTPHSYSGAFMTEAVECSVTEELQGDYLLNMTYPVRGILADKIAVDTFIVAQVDELANDGLQVFRIRKINADGVSGLMEIEASHISYEANGLVFGTFNDQYGKVTPTFASTDGSSVKIRLDGYNYFPFYSNFEWSSSVTKGFTSTVPVTARAMIGDNDNSYINLANLEPLYDNGITHLLTRRGSDKNITLRYGRDITAISQSIDTTDCVAFVVGYYQKDDVGTYYKYAFYSGHHQWDLHCPAKVINFTSSVDNDTTTSSAIRARLQQLVADEIANNPDADKPIIQMDISFERTDLADTYASILESQAIRLGDSVNVLYPPLNINTSVRVVKTDYNVLLGRYNTVTLGSIQTTLAKGTAKTTTKVNHL